MKKLSCIFGYVICLIIGLIVALPVTASAATDVSGIITTDTTWTLSDSPYIVTGSVLVNSSVTLTIEPGVIVKFDSTKAIQIEGTLIAIGTDTDNIIFTSNQPSPTAGDWGYILFADSSTDAVFDADGNYAGGSILEYSVIEYGGLPNGALLMYDAHPFINYCVIMDNFTGIDADNLTGTLKITNSSISNNTYAIRVSGGTVIISNNTISDNADTGIDTFAGTAIISNNTISDNGNAGIDANGIATISGNTISNNVSGIYAYRSSTTILDNTISDNTSYGIYIYNGIATISGNTISDNANEGIYVFYGTATISYNNIRNNTAQGIHVYFGTATISYNNIRNNTADNGSGIFTFGRTVNIFGNTIAENIATGADSSTVFIEGPSIFNYNDIFNNTATYKLYNKNAAGTPNVDATNNWWGTSIESEIQASIYDWFVDISKGIVDYYPYLDSPNEIEPYISASPASKDFGSVDVGAGSAAAVFTVLNYGSADLEISEASLAGANPDQFTVTGDTCSGAVVAPAESCTIDVVFSPTDAAAMSASLAIISNDPGMPELNIGLSGTGLEIVTEPDISANPASSDFGSVDVGAGSAVVVFTVSNNGSADLEISGASLTGTNPDQFAVTGDTCSGAAVAPAESCTIDVVFSPTDAAAMSASLVINSNDPDTPELNIGLSGTGVDIADEYKGKGNGWRNGKN